MLKIFKKLLYLVYFRIPLMMNANASVYFEDVKLVNSIAGAK